jgi:hypothetical protein
MLHVDVKTHSITWDDIEDLHFLSRLSNAGQMYAYEGGRHDISAEYSAFGSEIRHACTETLQAESKARREAQK